MDFKILLNRRGAENLGGGGQCGKFVTRNRDIGRAILMLSIYLLLSFQNLGCAISKLSSRGGVSKSNPQNFLALFKYTK